MRTLPVLAAPCLPQLARADDPLPSARDFEAFVESRAFDTHDCTGRYGVETFLPGRRTI